MTHGDREDEASKAQPVWGVQGPDLIEASKKVKPSALRETTVEVPHVRWSDIGGQVGQTRNPEPESLCPKSQTLDLETRNLSPMHTTEDPKPQKKKPSALGP